MQNNNYTDEQTVSTGFSNEGWSGPIRAGSVVCANYCTFEGIKSIGIFLVLYDEQFDAANNFKGNVAALKVTTSFDMITNYCVPLTPENNSFMERECMVLCSKIHTMNKKQIYKILGRVSSYTLKQVYKQYRRFESELERQMEDYM